MRLQCQQTEQKDIKQVKNMDKPTQKAARRRYEQNEKHCFTHLASGREWPIKKVVSNNIYHIQSAYKCIFFYFEKIHGKYIFLY